MTQSEYRALADFRYHIRRFLHFSEEAARAEGLEPQQHQLLLAIQGLSGTGGPTIGDVAEHLAIKHHSVVGLVDRLEQRGLVERTRGEGDRRQVRLSLTPTGADKLQHLSRIHLNELRHSAPGLIQSLQQ